jgi:hypothetical protein
MRKPVLVLALVVTAGAIVAGALALRPAIQLAPRAPAPARPSFTTEQQWIVSEVTAAIAGVAGMDSPGIGVIASTDSHFSVTIAGIGEPVSIDVVDHLWTADTFEPIARRLLSQARSSASSPSSTVVDLNVRAALTDLTVARLLEEDDRVSSAMQRNPRSAATHESAALLIAAFAFRESATFFTDLRPALSRMAAHLAVAKAQRGAAAETRDGAYARAAMTTLVGLQRKALLQIADLERDSSTEAERAWARALRLRNTGDWRAIDRASIRTALEKWEYVRAVRTRHGISAFLDHLDDQTEDDAPEWHRIVFEDLMKGFSVEAGNRFADVAVDRELAEAGVVWGHYHPNTKISPEGLIAALNDRPAPSPVSRVDGRTIVHVLDWGTWAAFHQRHVCASLAGLTNHLRNLGASETLAESRRSLEATFGTLTLFPIVQRWGAPTADVYEAAMARARPLVDTTPELVTHAAWNVLLYRPDFTAPIKPFPLQVAWFTPAVPTGTALDLFSRSLRPGCPRPPTRGQAKIWAVEQPFDHWTVWAEAYLALDRGEPSYAVVRRAFGPLMDYDIEALLKISYRASTNDERIDVGERLCRLSADQCGTLAASMLVTDREAQAVAAYERWIAGARDRVGLSNGVTWISRYYLDHGRADRAEAVASEAAETGSWMGMQTYAELLDRLNRPAEAEPLYQRIAMHYSNATAPLGNFLMRRALRTRDAALEAKAGELLRPVFPGGLNRVEMHALPPEPPDGITFDSFGQRPAKFGLRPTDVIVGIDEWRVHNVDQYTFASRLRFDDQITFTIWRNQRYEQLRMRLPQRWLGTYFRQYLGPQR